MSNNIKQKAVAGVGKFAVRPFSAIKGIAVEQKPVESKPVVMTAPRELRSQGDEDLYFLTEMAGVTRINIHSAPQQSQSTVKSRRNDPSDGETDDSTVFLDALKEMKLDVNFAEAVSVEDVPVAPRKVSRMRQLRRGTIRLDLEIDLHGLTREEAVDALASFVGAAARRSQQAVLVITGKGVHSEGEPVLQVAVAEWLKNAGRQWVAEFVTAPRDMGGEGAIVVFLKGLH